MIVYLAGPITAKDGFTIEQNVEQAAAIWYQLVQACIPTFCPQLGAALQMSFSLDYDVWMNYDFKLISISSHVLMLPRWESSYGACLEREHAELFGKRICYDVSEILKEHNALQRF